MSKYTAEQVIYAADLEQARYDGDLTISEYLRDYAALLRERESAKAAVTDGLSPVTLAVIGRKHFGNPIPKEWYAAAKELLARPFEAVAPMLASARVPDGDVDFTSDEVGEAMEMLRKYRSSIPTECLDQMERVLLAAAPNPKTEE